ncbi:hypothetical protein [Orbus mooreae]|uniref:hypothetical protein n=1 Tax=Orbus mooreae TaxID=3074107 RepID=UPI00370D19E7
MNRATLTELSTIPLILDLFFNNILPELLFVLLISSIIFYRYRILLGTLKNSLLLLIIALLLYAVTYLFYLVIINIIPKFIFGDFYYVSHNFYTSLYGALSSIIIYILIGGAFYYLVAILRNKFDLSDTNFNSVYHHQQLAQIHLVLFILLLLFIGAVIYQLLFLLIFLSRSIGRIEDYVMMSIIVTLSVLILYFILRRSFTAQFQRIEVAKLIKCVIVSYLFSVVSCFIISFVLSFILLFILSNFYYSRHQLELYVFILVFAVQIIVTCVVMRLVTRQYFGQYSLSNKE